MFRGRIKVTSTIALYLTLNISETVRDRDLVPPLVADVKFHHRILRGSHRTGASNKGGVRKFSDFLALSVNISKKVVDRAKVT